MIFQVFQMYYIFPGFPVNVGTLTKLINHEKHFFLWKSILSKMPLSCKDWQLPSSNTVTERAIVQYQVLRFLQL